RRRHTRFSRDWSSDVCSSDLPGAHAVADGFDQRLGEQAAEATEGVGGLEGGLVYLAFEPAVVNQAVEDPSGLFAVVADAPLVVIVALEQGRAFQCFAEDVQHLFALERLAVVGAGAVQAVVQQAQAFDDLFAVLAGQWFEELQALVGEEHRASGAGESAAYYAACGQGFELYLVGMGGFCGRRSRCLAADGFLRCARLVDWRCGTADYPPRPDAHPAIHGARLRPSLDADGPGGAGSQPCRIRSGCHGALGARVRPGGLVQVFRYWADNRWRMACSMPAASRPHSASMLLGLSCST